MYDWLYVLLILKYIIILGVIKKRRNVDYCWKVCILKLMNYDIYFGYVLF